MEPLTKLGVAQLVWMAHQREAGGNLDLLFVVHKE
jgi:hypothetical protein